MSTRPLHTELRRPKRLLHNKLKKAALQSVDSELLVPVRAILRVFLRREVQSTKGYYFERC
jgi:hypothetical protein